MSESNRRADLTFGIIGAIAAAALAVAVWGGLSWSNQHREHREEREAAASDQQENVREQVEAQCVGVPRSRTFSCTMDAPRTPGDEQYAIHDLRAQQDMSEWAFAMFITAAIGALITLAGVIYVAMTLHETRRAAEATVEANKTARDGFRLASENAARELRAYVYIQSLSNGVVKNGVLEDGAIADGLIPEIRFHNSGKTPAVDAKIDFRLAVIPPDKYRDFQFDPIDLSKATGVAIGPDGAASIPLRFIHVDDLRAAYANEATILFVVRIEYRDVIDPSVSHHTQVGYKLNIRGDPVAAIARRSLFEAEAEYRMENRFCSFS